MVMITPGYSPREVLIIFFTSSLFVSMCIMIDDFWQNPRKLIVLLALKYESVEENNRTLMEMVKSSRLGQKST